MALKSLLLEAQREELALEFLTSILKNSPFAGKVFLAGGAVRDAVMGRDVKDIDIVVTEPEGGIRFAEWLTKKLGVYKQGANPVIFPRFGTAKLNMRGVNVGGVDLSDLDIECVMTRGEEYTPGSRKPQVAYADLAKDGERRDFTINSLYKDLTTGEVLDPTGKGFADIKNGVIRTPTDPDITFKDDPLRMLRAIRFASRFNWKLPRSLVESLVRNAPMLKNISAERVQDEFNKMIMSDHPDMALKALSATGLLKEFLPEFQALKGVQQNKYHDDDVFGHVVNVIKNTPKDLKARLAAVFHDIAKPQTHSVDPETGSIHFYEHEHMGAEMARQIMHRLRYPNDVIDSVAKIVENHMKLKTTGEDGNKLSDKGLRRFVAALGDDLESAFALMHGDNLSHAEGHQMPDQIPTLLARTKSLAQAAPTKPTLPINGNDLMQAFNLTPGPQIKHLLAAVQDAWYENPQMSREDAFQVAKTAHADVQSQAQAGFSEDIMNRRVRNPETGNDILIRTALEYDKSHPAFQLVTRIMKNSQQ